MPWRMPLLLLSGGDVGGGMLGCPSWPCSRIMLRAALAPAAQAFAHASGGVFAIWLILHAMVAVSGSSIMTCTVL
jgi:hypothetical protein